MFDASIISHFGAGLKDEKSSAVLGQADTPNTVQGMLEAAKAVEAEQAKIGNPGTSSLAVAEEADLDPLADLRVGSGNWFQTKTSIRQVKS